MEVNIKNAYQLFIKLSLEPYLPFYRVITHLIENEVHKVTKCILQNPFYGLIIILAPLIGLTVILVKSILVLGGVACVTVSIIIFEGLVTLCFGFIIFINVLIMIVIFLIVYK